jgi:hypothetical protein
MTAGAAAWWDEAGETEEMRGKLSSTGRTFRRLPGLAAGSGTAADGSASHVEAGGDIFIVLPRGIAIADVSVVHPLSTHLLHLAATTAGAAASHRDQQKRNTFARQVVQQVEQTRFGPSIRKYSFDEREARNT